ncbi:MAG TPA: hypothetical protein P5048_00200, partial [Chlamydiales bacterium]|nr:hypothetical protein [Chlamydiales bacterium]
MAIQESYLSEFSIEKNSFSGLDQVFNFFKTDEFLQLSDFEKHDVVNKKLLTFIKQEKDPCFLLYPVIEYISKINQEKILPHYNFYSFELWLNQYSELSKEDNYHIRGKIAGKYLPREEYQRLFP